MPEFCLRVQLNVKSLACMMSCHRCCGQHTSSECNFTMAFKSEATMRLIYKAKNTAWPGGDVHKVVKALFKKYRPIDMMTLVEL